MKPGDLNAATPDGSSRPIAGAAFDPSEHPHRRHNPLNGNWVLVSPHRARRPWQGEEALPQKREAMAYSPDCYLCAGNRRASGVRNPDYEGPFVFHNDFAALQPASPEPSEESALRRVAPAKGEARVVCFSADHSRTLPELDVAAVREIIDVWCDQSRELNEQYAYVQVFENKGEAMGCSSPHPHGQIWATSHVPTEIEREDVRQAEWKRDRGEVLLEAMLRSEDAAGARTVESNEHWSAIVPWSAAWPFETLVVARDEVGRLEQLAPAARDALAELLRRLTARYDNLFATSFPYSMGWHQVPAGSLDPAAWRLHAHFYPPLLRSASVRKFMVGYEMLAEAQRDLTPEQAAERLRAAAPTLERRS